MKKALFLLTLALPILPAFVVFLICCKTTVPAKADSPAELSFVFQALPEITIPGEVGGRSENPTDETGLLKNAFREAYVEALLRGVDLTGVLGSDRVNPWPASEPLGWTQNWKTANEEPNSWGLPNLALAVGSYPSLAGLPELSKAAAAQTQVFTVYGKVLDMYGKSLGYARANGAAGYGIPLGEQFFVNGTAVQRFTMGRIIIGKEQSRFSFQDDLSLYVLENQSPEEKEREFGGRNIPPEAVNAFANAWAFAFSEKEGTSDGSITRVAFSKPWMLEAGEEKISVQGFYYKSYNKAQDVLVLLDSERLPLRVHRLSGLFLKTILSNKRLPGMGLERKLGAAAGTGLGRSLAGGFALYGPPLSDPLPWPNQNAATGNADEELFLEAQRFARGWMVVKTVQRIEEPNGKKDEDAMLNDEAELILTEDEPLL